MCVCDQDGPVNKEGGSSIYIESLVPGGPADRGGVLRPGHLPLHTSAAACVEDLTGLRPDTASILSSLCPKMVVTADVFCSPPSRQPLNKITMLSKQTGQCIRVKCKENMTKAVFQRIKSMSK